MRRDCLLCVGEREALLRTGSSVDLGGVGIIVGHELFDVMESRRNLRCRNKEPESWLDAVELAVIGLDCLEFLLFISELLLQ